MSGRPEYHLAAKAPGEMATSGTALRIPLSAVTSFIFRERAKTDEFGVVAQTSAFGVGQAKDRSGVDFRSRLDNDFFRLLEKGSRLIQRQA